MPRPRKNTPGHFWKCSFVGPVQHVFQNHPKPIRKRPQTTPKHIPRHPKIDEKVTPKWPSGGRESNPRPPDSTSEDQPTWVFWPHKTAPLRVSYVSEIHSLYVKFPKCARAHSFSAAKIAPALVALRTQPLKNSPEQSVPEHSAEHILIDYFR